MKNIVGICIICFSCIVFCGCQSNSATSTDANSTEESFTISKQNIHCSGKHASLIKIEGDAQVILSETPDKNWKIQLLVPISNTKNWNDWNREMNESGELAPDLEYEACMGRFRVVFLNSKGDSIACPMQPEGDHIESLLSSEIIVNEDFMAQSTISGDYKKMKAIFKQIKKIAFVDMELNIVKRSVASNTLGADSENIDFDEIYRQAKRTYDEEMRNSSKKD